MHDALLADAARPARVTILGLLMLDYTIGHELLLIQRRNPLVTYLPDGFAETPVEFQAAALAEAALICCVREPRWKNRWSRKASQFSSREEFDVELLKFRNYRDLGSLDLPLVRMPKTPGAHFHFFGSPELAQLINYVDDHHALMITRHFDGSPLNFPIGLARILYTTQQETAGNVWVANRQDADNKARLEAFESQEKEPGLALGDDAIQKMAEKWNADHPEAKVILPKRPAI